MADDLPENKPSGRYKDGNTAEDGGYIVGRSKTPEGGKFRKGDGRPRGRRAKGTRNFDTDVLAEASSRIAVNESGKTVKITKQQALVKKIFSSAFDGNAGAMREAVSLIQGATSRSAERKERVLPEADEEVIREFFADLMANAGDDADGNNGDALLGGPSSDNGNDDAAV